MLARFREWTVYASGTVVFVLAGVGVPLLVLEQLRGLLVTLPGRLS
jgi:hypothetical protein